MSPEVFKTRNIIIGFDAVSFLAFNSCKPSIALSPNGVAALSKPSILAARFIKILPTTGCPLGTSGKRRAKTGPSKRASALTTPPFSPTFIMPSHNESTPVSPKDISKPCFDVSNVDCIMAGKTVKSAKKINFTNATIKAMRKKAIQI